MRHDRVTGVNICAHPIPSVWGKKLTADFNGGNQSSDGGLVLLREAECKLGLLPVGPGRDPRIRIRRAPWRGGGEDSGGAASVEKKKKQQDGCGYRSERSG